MYQNSLIRSGQGQCAVPGCKGGIDSIRYVFTRRTEAAGLVLQILLDLRTGPETAPHFPEPSLARG